MKLVVLLLCLGLFSALLRARDLQTLAKKERARRQAIRSEAHPSRSFTDADLEAFKTEPRNEQRPHRLPKKPNPARRRPPRDLAKEKTTWQRRTLENERELARLDARIRRLVWRLREHRARRRERGALGDDPTTSLLEESIESLSEERDRRATRFREGARKAGAFPGWLR